MNKLVDVGRPGLHSDDDNALTWLRDMALKALSKEPYKPGM